LTVSGTTTLTGAATLTANPTLSAGTANGVLYLNGSKVATSGAGLTFDGTNVATTGTASATKLIPTGGAATGNGMYLPAANTLGFSTNGVLNMSLDGSGNLGIGVTPSARLHVGGGGNILLTAVTNGSDGLIDIRDSGAVTRLVAYCTTNEAWFGTVGSKPIAFQTNNTERMRLDASGNLGLNTSTFGTSAAGVLALGTGTAPTTGVADTVQFFSVDRSAGNTIPAIRCEGSGVTNAGITNTTVTNKIAVQVNGTIYYLLATTNAT
jgi:hypothetical protein